MLFVSNIAEVNAAFIAKTPRPMRDMMLEIYPDAKEDCNGRFHAPYDGYLCKVTNCTFKAGEFLPVNGDSDFFATGPGRKIPRAVDAAGVVHEWNGSNAQNVAVWGVLIQQTKARDAALSGYIGTIGVKVELVLTIVHIETFAGIYGNTHLHIMRDGSGNVVIYKGSNKRIAAKGASIRISAKVKSQGERNGVKQTVIERPKIL